MRGATEGLTPVGLPPVVSTTFLASAMRALQTIFDDVLRMRAEPLVPPAMAMMQSSWNCAVAPFEMVTVWPAGTPSIAPLQPLGGTALTSFKAER